jgi:uncharacterized protein involved in exopolysaccharide biosynthesis
MTPTRLEPGTVPVYLVPVAVGEMPGSMDLSGFVVTVLRSWRWMLLGLIVGSGLGFAASYVFTLWYRSTAVVMPAPEDRNASALTQAAAQFGGLASLAGIRLPSSGSTRTEALATLKAKRFVGDFISSRKLLPVLFARQWDGDQGRWRVPEADVPTLDDAVELFQQRILNVKEDPKTGLIEVIVDWRDRNLSATWANELVVEANARVRGRAIEEAQRSLQFLNAELERAEVIETRQAITRLIESQLNSVTLANSREQYALIVMDPAQPPSAKKYVRPNRIAFAALGAILMMIAAASWRLSPGSSKN